MNIAAVFWFFFDIARLDVEVFEFEGEFVDGDDVFSGVVLESARQKGLGEEESYIRRRVPEIQKHLGVPLSIQFCKN